MNYIPSYLKIYETGDLGKRIKALYDLFDPCELCPQHCRTNRLQGELGVCQGREKVLISSAIPHFGEETPLTGHCGSGTIFFSYCNLRCIYCQNYEISCQGGGKEITLDELSNCMLFLQSMGCHNLNLVTPTHYTPQIIDALSRAIKQGLSIPLVWNCGGFESLKVLKLLEGIVDIYLPDIKYADIELARKYSHAPEYPYISQAALREMQRQTGELKIDDKGIAYRGLLIRHLILPDNLLNSKRVLEFIAQKISLNSYVNIMDQYQPTHLVLQYPELNRRITLEEYEEVIEFALKIGLRRGFSQE